MQARDKPQPLIDVLDEIVAARVIKHVGLHHGSSYLEHVDFAEAIRTGSAPKVTLMDGLRSAALTRSRGSR